MRAGISGKILILLPFLTILLFTACASGVSQEQYNALQAELKSAREQLVELKSIKEQLAVKTAELESLKSQVSPVKNPQASAGKTWAAMKPYIELNILILDDMATISQQNSKQITTAYANMQYADQRNRLTELLKNFSDRDFAETVKSAWAESDTMDPQLKWQYWAKTYITLGDYLRKNCDFLTGQLNP